MTLSEICVAGAVRALNGSGRMLGRYREHVPSLSAESLMRAARRRARLDDFGDWPIAEPLERLLESYHREARLTLVGRITVREMIVSLLESLLNLEAERAADPGVIEEPVEAPVFIVGLPRTGTTLLHGLVTEDPLNRVPLTWEVMYPAGHGNTAEGIERARRQTGARLEWANRLAPEFRRIHPIAPDLPQECIAITAPVFMSIQFHTTHNVASYQDWFERDSQRLAFDFHRRLLQHLQRQRAAQALGTEGARSSVQSRPAAGTLPGRERSCRRIAIRCASWHRWPVTRPCCAGRSATAPIRARSLPTGPTAGGGRWITSSPCATARRPASFSTSAYEEIEARPIETVERMYEFLGWPLTGTARARMEAFLAANPKKQARRAPVLSRAVRPRPQARAGALRSLLRALRHTGAVVRSGRAGAAAQPTSRTGGRRFRSPGAPSAARSNG
jgi:hypothetical protein